MAQPAQARFLTGAPMRHVAVMSVTSSVGLMAVFAVDFADMLFISMLGQAELAAAVGYAAAILFFTTSFGIGMAIAAGALVARAVGQGDMVLARGRATSALVLGLAAGIGFSAAVWMSLDPLVTLLGATGRTHDLAVHYLAIVVPSMPLLLVGMIGGAILRAHGDARRAMAATLWGAGVNAVLDPILIFGLGLDLTGAALATVISRAVIAGTALLPILRHHGGFSPIKRDDLMADLRPVALIAGPAILTQLATPVGQAVVTRAMAEHGEAAVAGMAIVSRLTPLAFGILFALSGAVGPILGQNYGAGQFDRVRQTYRDGLLFCAAVTALVSALLFALRGPLAAMFGAEGVTREILFLFCGPLALVFGFNGAIFVANAAMNNLGRPLQSTMVNWGRHTLGTIPLVVLGSATLGASGVLIGQAAGGVLFGLIAVWLGARTIRRAEAEGATPQPPSPADEARLHDLLHRRR
jgi:putative MATE family efflux protein